MVRISSFLLILVVYFLHRNEPVAGAQREVLVRDRLVFLLCDQLNSYMKDGKLPQEVKVMPEKYKKIHPGKNGQAGRMFAGYFDEDDDYFYRRRRGAPVPVLDLNDELF